MLCCWFLSFMWLRDYFEMYGFQAATNKMENKIFEKVLKKKVAETKRNKTKSI